MHESEGVGTVEDRTLRLQGLAAELSTGGGGDARLRAAVDCIDAILAEGREAVRMGVVDGVELFVEMVREDLGGPAVAVELDELVHLPMEPAQDLASQALDAGRAISTARSAGALSNRRVLDDVAVGLVGLSCAAMHLSDPDLVHATTLLDRVSDAERAFRRARLTMGSSSIVDPGLERSLAEAIPILQEITEVVVAALSAREDVLLWRAWRGAGGDGDRERRAVQMAMSMGLGRHVERRLASISAEVEARRAAS